MPYGSASSASYASESVESPRVSPTGWGVPSWIASTSAGIPVDISAVGAQISGVCAPSMVAIARALRVARDQEFGPGHGRALDRHPISLECLA